MTVYGGTHRLPDYPKDHKVGMRVPRGGSNCAKCEYLREPNDCAQKDFVKWNGANLIPLDKEVYCCDFFETR